MFVFIFSFLGWNKDFKPGPLPKNEEERRAAAKKYGLLPEEYKTYPEDCMHTKKTIFFPNVNSLIWMEIKENCTFFSAIWWLSAFRRQTIRTKRYLLSIRSSWTSPKFWWTSMKNKKCWIKRVASHFLTNLVHFFSGSRWTWLLWRNSSRITRKTSHSYMGSNFFFTYSKCNAYWFSIFSVSNSKCGFGSSELWVARLHCTIG